MSNRIPVDLFGSGLYNNALSNSNDLTIQEADRRFLNISSDTMEGELDMNNQLIKNIKDPEDESDVVNKG